MQAIDTATNKIVATIPCGQLPQALVHVPNAAAHTEEGPMASLLPLATLKESKTYHLRSKDETLKARASVTVISLGLIDEVQIAASGLTPGQEYTLSMVDTVTAPRVREALAKLKATPAGNAIADTLGPVRGVPGADAGPVPAAFLLEPVDEKAGPVLMQK